MSKKRGFTIIEVVLVLAIAGLIFLMVFLALPAMMRNQRNEQRRETVNKVYGLIPQYQKNNHGRLPFDVNRSDFDVKFVTNYIDSNCTGPIEVYGDDAGGASGGGWTFESCGEEFTDPDGEPLVAVRLLDGDAGSNEIFSGKKTEHVIYFGSKLTCGSDATLRVAESNNSYVVIMVLEGGAIYCVDTATTPGEG